MTKAMVVSITPNSPNVNIVKDGQQIGQVSSFVYLGSLIIKDGRFEKEIKEEY